MQRLRRFIGLEIRPERLADRSALPAFGARARWIPETIEEFDEIELAFPLDEEREVVLTFALENGRIARILVGGARAGDDDADTVGFEESEVAAVLDRHAGTFVRLLDHLTG
jgi:hypothetical protein